MPDDDAAIGVVRRVALRKFLEHAHERDDEEREIGQGSGRTGIEVLAQRFQLRHIDLLDVSEMGNVALGLAHLLRDQAPHTDHLDLFGSARALVFGRRTVPDMRLRMSATAVQFACDEGIEVLSHDAAVRP